MYTASGFSDNVKCFYCNGGLRNWEKGDEPWHEHARWFQKCPFVLMVKGQDYINAINAERSDDAPILAQSRPNVSFNLFTFCPLGNIALFLSSTDFFFQNLLFRKIL